MLIVIRVSLAEHWVLNTIRNLAASSYRENEVCTHHLSFKRLVKQKGVAVAIGSSNNSKVLPSQAQAPGMPTRKTCQRWLRSSRYEGEEASPCIAV